MTRRRFISTKLCGTVYGSVILCSSTKYIAKPRLFSNKQSLLCSVSSLGLSAFHRFGVVTFEVRCSCIVSPPRAYSHTARNAYKVILSVPPLFQLSWTCPTEWMATICHNVGAEVFTTSTFTRGLPGPLTSPTLPRHKISPDPIF